MASQNLFRTPDQLTTDFSRDWRKRSDLQRIVFKTLTACNTFSRVYAARYIMSIRARTIAKKSIYSMAWAIYKGHMRGIILGAFATSSVANRLYLYPLRY